MKNNKNIIDAIINIVKNPILELKEYSISHNRANSMGEALEEYIKFFQVHFLKKMRIKGWKLFQRYLAIWEIPIIHQIVF